MQEVSVRGSIKPGTSVSWESQAAGHWKTKTGVVIAFLPAHSDAGELMKRLGFKGRLRGNRVSKVDRYLVRVGVGTRIPHYYTPRAEVLEAGLDPTRGQA